MVKGLCFPDPKIFRTLTVPQDMPECTCMYGKIMQYKINTVRLIF